jgi:hypothetical protein
MTFPGNEQNAPDDEIEIVEAEAQARPPTVVQTGQTPKDEGDELASLKASVTDANRRTEEETQKRAEAERQRDEAQSRIKAEIDARFASNEVAITNALAAYSQKESALRADLTGASQRGDHARVAELIEEMADVKANKLAAAAQQRDLARDKAEFARRAEEAAKRPADPLANVSQPTKQWFTRNPNYAPNGPMFNKALEADALAIRARLQPDTPEYFDFVDQHLGLKAAPETQQEAPQPPKAPARQPMPAAAPPSRGNGNGQPRITEKITLTPEDRRYIETSPVLGETLKLQKQPDTFAARVKIWNDNKKALIKEGRLNA